MENVSGVFTEVQTPQRRFGKVARNLTGGPIRTVSKREQTRTLPRVNKDRFSLFSVVTVEPLGISLSRTHLLIGLIVFVPGQTCWSDIQRMV